MSVELELVNFGDEVLARAGNIAPEAIRRVKLTGIVDTGAAHLVIPKTVADQLGVPVAGEARVRFADSRSA